MTATLYGLGVSPWTERARWALHHHRIPYAYKEHVPMLGEVFLRMRARTTKATVPLLVDGDQVVMDSVAIGRHAERVGLGAPLFPTAHEAEIDRWVGLAERALHVGRARLLARILERPEAQAESLPAFIPAGLRRALAPTAAMGTRFLARKYDVGADIDTQVQSTLRPALTDLRAAVGRGTYLVSGTFSFADIAVASAMHVLRPRDDGRYGPATREAWTNEELAGEFGDLVEWRDAIYAKHR